MIIGHQRILQFLRQSLVNRRVAHAYLFIGPAHVGKYTVALEFIKMLNSWPSYQVNHPDVLLIEPEISQQEEIKKESRISIKQIKKIQHQLSLSPYQADYKIALINQAEKMTKDAGNCLLKTLEEPTGQAVLLLISAHAQNILPTIISRCQKVHFLLVGEKDIEKELGSVCNKEAVLGKIIRLANGRPGLAIDYLKNPRLLKEEERMVADLKNLVKADLNKRYQYAETLAKDVFKARQTLTIWLSWFRDLLLFELNCSNWLIRPEVSQYAKTYPLQKIKSIIEQIRQTEKLISNSSVNIRLALEVLMLEL